MKIQQRLISINACVDEPFPFLITVHFYRFNNSLQEFNYTIRVPGLNCNRNTQSYYIHNNGIAQIRTHACTPTYTYTYTQTHIHTNMHTHNHTCLPTCKSYLPTYLTTYLPSYLPTSLPIYLHTFLPA